MNAGFQLIPFGTYNLENIDSNLVLLTLQHFAIFFFFLKIFWCGPFLKSLLNLLQYCFCFMLWVFGCQACGILAPLRRTEVTPCTERWSLNHWTSREVPPGHVRAMKMETHKDGVIWAKLQGGGALLFLTSHREVKFLLVRNVMEP